MFLCVPETLGQIGRVHAALASGVDRSRTDQAFAPGDLKLAGQAGSPGAEQRERTFRQLGRRLERKFCKRLVGRPQCSACGQRCISRLRPFDQMVRHPGGLGAVSLGDEPSLPM